MSMPDPPAPKPRASRGIKIILGVSLALNLLIFGAIAGAFLGGRPGGDARERIETVRLLGLGPLAIALDREDRVAVIAAAGADPASMRVERRRLVAAARGFAEAVQQEAFDRAAVGAALQVQRDVVGHLQDRGHEALLDQLEAMDHAERVAFAESLLALLSRRRR